eukprot:Opistho-1_new@2081
MASKIGVEDIGAFKAKIIEELVAVSKETEGWDFLLEKEGVRISRKKTDESKIHIVKGEGDIDAPVDVVLNYVWGLDERKAWDELYMDGRVVEEYDASASTVYQQYKTPGPASNRDFVFFRVREKLADGSVIVAGKSVKHQDVPKSSDFTRAKILSSGSVMTPLPNGHTHVVYTVQLDPCGLVPAFIANIVAEKQPLVISVIRKKIHQRRASDAAQQKS